MASRILVVAIALRLARNRPRRPVLQRACLVQAPNLDATVTYVRGANLGNGSRTIEK